MSVQAERQTHPFQAEVVQILDLMIHSLYSNKEIFLRELISNASDAIDRLRFEIFTRPGLDDGEGPLQIRVCFDAAARTITVSDNGIGMSRAEVIEHIGTIAKSGTREFLQALTGDQRKDATLIGQFGVGFYSSFVVADRVTLTTRRAGLPASDGVRWESGGAGEYTLETVQRTARGTEIVLHLRDGEDDLLSDYRLRSIIQKYSDHISLPILMPEPAPAEGKPAETVINSASALWARPKSEISQQDYENFYRHITGDVSKPLAYLHSKIEGTYEYTLLLFVPARAPWDLWLPDLRRGVKLHVRRVFVLEGTGQLMPAYLRFVRGVIDSSDLPLNISREMLQGSRAVGSIRSSAVRKVLRLLGDMAENGPQKYTRFWAEFGATLKEGIPEDYSNRGEIAKLLRFPSTMAGADGDQVSLADYVARMRDGQEKIYYLLAPTLAAATASPHLEAFREKGIEVLLLPDAVDHWVMSSLQEFEGRRFGSVAHGVPDFGALQDESEREAAGKAAAETAGLVARMKEILGGKITDVRVTTRLTTSPACIVASDPETDVDVVQRMRGSGLPRQPVLEINPRHPLVARLSSGLGDPRLAEWAQVLYGQAVLTAGARLDAPAAFVSGLNDLLVMLTTLTDAAPADDPPAMTPGRWPAVHSRQPRLP